MNADYLEIRLLAVERLPVKLGVISRPGCGSASDGGKDELKAVGKPVAFLGQAVAGEGKMAKPKGRPKLVSGEIRRKGPFLSAALIAEKVLTEADRTITIVRVVDKSSILPESVETIKNLKDSSIRINPLTIVLTFKAGGYGGKSALLVEQGGPSGKSEPLGVTEIPFDGTEGRSYNVFCPVVVKWEKDGFYWFDISLDNKFLTRIPLELNVGANLATKEQV